VSLAGVMGEAACPPPANAAPFVNPLSPKSPQFPARAKRVIHFFLNGGPCTWTRSIRSRPSPFTRATAAQSQLQTERKTGAPFRRRFKFQKHGRSGIEVSEYSRTLAESIDEIADIRSMQRSCPIHEPSLMLIDCGDAQMARPSVGRGSPMASARKTKSAGLIAMFSGGYPSRTETGQSDAGVCLGTLTRSIRQIEKLIEHIRKLRVAEGAAAATGFTAAIERGAPGETPADGGLGRELQFRLAYRMQLEARMPSTGQEPEHVRRMYGEGVHARQTLIGAAVERGCASCSCGTVRASRGTIMRISRGRIGDCRRKSTSPSGASSRI